MVKGIPIVQTNDKVKYAEFAVILMNELKPTGKSVELRFANSIPSWAQESIEQALEAEIIKGYEDETFRSTESITRLELAVMISLSNRKDVISATSTGCADEREFLL